MRYKLDARDIGANETKDDVAKVQRYLYRFGYLRTSFEPGKLDLPTQDALRAYQARAGLSPTGDINESTAQSLEEPRCGVPDFPRTITLLAGVEAFALSACRYTVTRLTYFIGDVACGFSLGDIRPSVRAAFDQWQRQIPVDFQEVGRSENAILKLAWEKGDHGDGEPFDGREGNVLAHAFLPPTCGGVHAGLCHFDNEERWGLNHSNGIRDIQTVALHEIGHLLGLGHNGAGVMFERYQGQLRVLTKGDIDSIQGLYGERP